MGRLSTGCKVHRWHLTVDLVGCLWNHDSPVWGLAGKENDHGSGERCSGLDLISGDRGPGYAARGINNRGICSGVSLMRLRGDVLVTSPSSLWV